MREEGFVVGEDHLEVIKEELEGVRGGEEDFGVHHDAICP